MEVVILGICCMACAMGVGVGSALKKPTLRLASKTLASLFFCMECAWSIYEVQTSPLQVAFGVRILVALLLGMLGDVFLCLDSFLDEQYRLRIYAMGMAAFLLGHLFYVYLFFSSAPFHWWLLVLVPVLPLGVLAAALLKIIDLPKALVPLSGAYSVVSALLVVATLNLMLSGSPKGTLVFVAALCFVVSDLCLAVHDYPAKKYKIHGALGVGVLVFYYLAQVLFAYSVLL